MAEYAIAIPPNESTKRGVADIDVVVWRVGRSSYQSTCWNARRTICSCEIRSLNVQNIRLPRDEVAGTSGGAYAAIPCAGANPVTAVIMGAGGDGTETSSLRDSLKQKITGFIRLA